MIQLSASMIKDFLVCSQRVYFRLNASEQAEKGPELLIGDLVHRFMEEYNKNPVFNYKEYLNKNYKNLPEKSIEKISTCLHNYWTYFQPLLSDTDKVETFFKLPYSQNILIVGRIDRINEERGILIDWKTGSKAPFNIDTDIQFMLYHWAYRMLYNKPPSLVALASLGTGKLIKYNLRPNYERILFDTIIPKVAHAIKENQFYKEGIFDYVSHGMLSTACTYCPFQRTCLYDKEEE